MILTISLALRLKRLKIIAIYLDGELTFNPAHCFFHVVGDRLREVPDDSGDLFQLLTHGCNQIFLILAEDRLPRALPQAPAVNVLVAK